MLDPDSIKASIKQYINPAVRLWTLRAVVILVAIVVAVMAWPAFTTQQWSDATGVGDYLPLRINENDHFVQPFVPQDENFTQINLSFDPPVELQDPDDLRMTLSFYRAGQNEADDTIVITGNDIERYTNTVIPVSAGDYQVGDVLEMHLSVESMGEDDILAIHAIEADENRLRHNDRTRGIAIAMTLTYHEFDSDGLISALALFSLILALLFVPLGWLKKVFVKVPVLPLLLAPIFVVVIIELLNTLNERVWLSPVLWIFSYLFILFIEFLFVIILKNDRLAVFISSGIFIAIAYANHMKQFFRGDPVYVGDITQVSMAIRSVNQLSYEASVRYLLAVLVLTIFILVFARTRKAGLLQAAGSRAAVGGATLLALYLLVGQFMLNDTLLVNYFNVSRYPWNQMMNYRQNGFILPLVQSGSDLFIGRPTLSDPIAEDFYLISEQQAEPERQKPNIVVVMNESFTDFNIINDINPSEPVMPYFDELRELDSTYSGNVLTPVFGGGTANTEFEYLTGSTMLFFHESSIPYLSYFNTPVHGIPDLLNQQGYRSVAIHSYIRSFWNRQTVYPAMGFDEFISLEDFPESDPRPIFVSDQTHYELIVDQLEQKEAQERLFLFSVTMQNHFPYYSTDENHAQLNYNIKLPEMVDSGDVELYLSMLRESDDALRYLVGYLESLDEPTLLVFFGDHLPGNNNAFNTFYAELFGKPMADLDLEESLKLYKTPYLIWANYELPEIEAEALTSPNFLGTMTLDLAGAEKSPYFEYVDSIRETTEAMNTTVIRMRNGRVYDRDSIPQAIVRQLDRYWMYQYDNVIRTLEP